MCPIFWVQLARWLYVSIAKDGRLFYGPHSGLTGAARGGIVKDMAKSGGGRGGVVNVSLCRLDSSPAHPSNWLFHRFHRAAIPPTQSGWLGEGGWQLNCG